jgi:hypothetical protein
VRRLFDFLCVWWDVGLERFGLRVNIVHPNMKGNRYIGICMWRSPQVHFGFLLFIVCWPFFVLLCSPSEHVTDMHSNCRCYLSSSPDGDNFAGYAYHVFLLFCFTSYILLIPSAWGGAGWGGMASRFFSKSPETIPLPFNSRKIIPPPF